MGCRASCYAQCDSWFTYRQQGSSLPNESAGQLGSRYSGERSSEAHTSESRTGGDGSTDGSLAQAARSASGKLRATTCLLHGALRVVVNVFITSCLLSLPLSFSLPLPHPLPLTRAIYRFGMLLIFMNTTAMLLALMPFFEGSCRPCFTVFFTPWQSVLGILRGI